MAISARRDAELMLRMAADVCLYTAKEISRLDGVGAGEELLVEVEEHRMQVAELLMKAADFIRDDVDSAEGVVDHGLR